MTNNPYKGVFKFDLTGEQFGLLTVIGPAKERSKYDGRLLWKCKCKCGNKTNLGVNILRRAIRVKQNISCGCIKKSQLGIASITHGHTVGRKWTRTYRSWAKMIERCTNPKTIRWNRYGGRGIKVCKRWLTSFENFLEDMGKRPKGKTLDRKNNDKGYYKRNCRWATSLEQVHNRSISRAA